MRFQSFAFTIPLVALFLSGSVNSIPINNEDNSDLNMIQVDSSTFNISEFGDIAENARIKVNKAAGDGSNSGEQFKIEAHPAGGFNILKLPTGNSSDGLTKRDAEVVCYVGPNKGQVCEGDAVNVQEIDGHWGHCLTTPIAYHSIRVTPYHGWNCKVQAFQNRQCRSALAGDQNRRKSYCINHLTANSLFYEAEP